MGSTLLVIIQVSVLLDPLHHHVDQPVLQGFTTFTSPPSPPARLLESDRPEELVCQHTQHICSCTIFPCYLGLEINAKTQ